MRIWLIREGVRVDHKNRSVDLGIQVIHDLEHPEWQSLLKSKIQMMMRRLKTSDSSNYSTSSYQVVQIKVQCSASAFESPSRKGKYHVGILDVDASPISSKHHSKWRQAVLHKAYNVAFKMKGLHTDTIYVPEIDLQKWLSESHFCNEVDCLNQMLLRRLSDMLMEVAIAMDFSAYLIWPEDINSPGVSPGYFAHFDDDDLALYHTFFNVMNNRRPQPVYGDLTVV